LAFSNPSGEDLDTQRNDSLELTKAIESTTRVLAMSHREHRCSFIERGAKRRRVAMGPPQNTRRLCLEERQWADVAH
jgi:hypothetical protein